MNNNITPKTGAGIVPDHIRALKYQQAEHVREVLEVAQQALETLETLKSFIDDAEIIEGQWHWLVGSDEVITALRSVLEQAKLKDCK